MACRSPERSESAAGRTVTVSASVSTAVTSCSRRRSIPRSPVSLGESDSRSVSLPTSPVTKYGVPQWA